MTGSGRPKLRPELEAVVREVLEASGLDITDGRDEVARELRAHFEDGLASGLGAEELIRRFGNPIEAGINIARTMPRAAARSRGETRRWWMAPGEWKNEVVRAMRRLRRAPGFTSIVVLTLALGVGVNTAIFSVLNAVLFQDLPYDDPGRLVRIYEQNDEWPRRVEFNRAPVVSEWRSWDDVFERVGVLYTYREVGQDLTDGDVPVRVTSLRVSAGYFETLGRSPLLGRTFMEEESFGAGEAISTTGRIADVTILSHGLWERRYGADPEIVGRTIQLDGVSFEVVGVMPASFRDPFGSQADVWIPQDLRRGGSNGFGNYYLSTVARLADGVSIEAATERVKTLATGFAEVEPEMAGWYPVIEPLQANVVGQTRRTMLWILAAAAGLVLLTACVNVANLLFARGLGQDRVLALRSALGSGRVRLVATILLENGLLAAMGGALGLALGWLGLRGLLGIAPDALPVVAEVTFGLPVFLFALAVTASALVIFGLTPALRMSRTAPADVLRSGDRASTVGRLVRRVRDGLVVVQLAAALTLVTGAILLTRSFDSLLDVALGVEEDGVLTFEVHLPTARYPDPADRVLFRRELQNRVVQMPGVVAAGATSWLPVNGRYHTWFAYWVSAPEGSPEDDIQGPTDVRVIEGDYFSSLGIEVLRGDPPSALDPDGEPIVWVNQELAADLFGSVDPLGQVVQTAGVDRRVVGVVENIPYSARGDVSPKVYVPHVQADGRNWALIQTVRTSGDPAGLIDLVRRELNSLDPNLVLYRPKPFSSVLATVRAQDRFATFLMGAFGLLALTLSLVGTYGVLSGTVAGRTREIGIRMALGADGGSIRKMVFRYAASLTIPGVVIGTVVAAAATRSMDSLLFGVETGDPLVYALATLVFVVVGVLAGWWPAQRATRVDTIEVLTTE